mmetsp:Transcript_39017/g.92051  ORF Transcript_39017/g.92051 Transcript_39017/m.92051 type:complete len:365 (+) Transcript_39017:61-1155(+)
MSARGRTWAGSIAGASSRLSTQAYLLAVVASILILGLMFIQFELEPVPVRRRPSTGDSVTSSNGTYWVENAKGVLEERLVDPWPTIFYLGVPKAGSTSLFFFLQKHPHVCAGHQHDDPQLVNKEVDFFIKPDLFVQGPPLYLSAFDRSAKCLELARAGIRGSFLDASTKYLLDTGAAQRLKQTIPPELHGKLRFVVVLREPVERDRSWQGQKARTAGKSMSDAEYLHSVHVRTQAPAQFPELRHGLYDTLLRGWWTQFPRDQFLVLSYDTLVANQTDTLSRIVSFLGLDPLPTAHDLSMTTWNEDPNKRAVTPLRELDPKVCVALAGLYAEHMDELYRLVNAPGMPPSQPAFPRFRDPCSSDEE